jgi:hypothetical protein
MNRGETDHRLRRNVFMRVEHRVETAMNGTPLERKVTVVVLLVAAQALVPSTPAHHVPAPFVVEEVDMGIQEAGRTVALDVSPTSDAIWLAASESGGLFQTFDSGTTWTRLDSLPPHRLYDVAFSPNTTGTILVTAWDDYPAGRPGIRVREA